MVQSLLVHPVICNHKMFKGITLKGSNLSFTLEHLKLFLNHPLVYKIMYQ